MEFTDKSPDSPPTSETEQAQKVDVIHVVIPKGSDELLRDLQRASNAFLTGFVVIRALSQAERDHITKNPTSPLNILQTVGERQDEDGKKVPVNRIQALQAFVSLQGELLSHMYGCQAESRSYRWTGIYHIEEMSKAILSEDKVKAQLGQTFPVFIGQEMESYMGLFLTVVHDIRNRSTPLKGYLDLAHRSLIQSGQISSSLCELINESIKNYEKYLREQEPFLKNIYTKEDISAESLQDLMEACLVSGSGFEQDQDLKAIKFLLVPPSPEIKSLKVSCPISYLRDIAWINYVSNLYSTYKGQFRGAREASSYDRIVEGRFEVVVRYGKRYLAFFLKDRGSGFPPDSPMVKMHRFKPGYSTRKVEGESGNTKDDLDKLHGVGAGRISQTLREKFGVLVETDNWSEDEQVAGARIGYLFPIDKTK